MKGEGRLERKNERNKNEIGRGRRERRNDKNWNGRIRSTYGLNGKACGWAMDRSELKLAVRWGSRGGEKSAAGSRGGELLERGALERGVKRAGFRRVLFFSGLNDEGGEDGGEEGGEDGGEEGGEDGGEEGGEDGGEKGEGAASVVVPITGRVSSGSNPKSSLEKIPSVTSEVIFCSMAVDLKE